jgi:hypothetical protein
MIVPNSNGHDMLGDLAAQENSAVEKRLVPASPTDFMRWVRETIREHRITFENLVKEHRKLVIGEDKATLGLKRLSMMIHFKDKPTHEHLMDMHRNYVFKNKDIGYTLGRCKRVLDETSTNLQFVGETLISQLADEGKKKAVQRELGLRLRDIDQDFSNCKSAVGNQKSIHKKLADGIQVLMHKAKIKLPPKVREDMGREEKVAQIALDLKNQVLKDKAPWAGKVETPKRVLKSVSLGEETSIDAEAPVAVETSDETSNKPNMAMAIAAVIVGLIAGTLIFYRDRWAGSQI